MGKGVWMTNSLIQLLAESKPGILEELRAQFPDLYDFLRPGWVAGEEKITDRRIEVTLKVAHESMLHQDVRQRVTRARTMGVWIQGIQAVSGLGVLAALFGTSSIPFALSSASINVAATVLYIISERMQTPFDGRRGNLLDLGAEVAHLGYESRRLESLLRNFLESGIPAAEVKDLVEEANQDQRGAFVRKPTEPRAQLKPRP